MSVQPLFDVIQADLARVEQELFSTIQTPVTRAQDISVHLVEAGGKRLRPALYLLCARSGSEYDSVRAAALATGLELIHMATLVHDDVIDNAATRRNRPTANTCWGNHQSVLTGDYLFAKAFSTISNHFDSGVMKLLSDMVCALCEGEILQAVGAFDPEQTEEEYQIRVAKKTADFLAVSCQLGGISAGLPKPDVQALLRYGYALGMAFQITDDILDFTASSEQLGKPAGNDLRQGIITLPLIYALRHSSRREELRELILKKNLDDAAVQRGLDIVHATDAMVYSYQEVNRYLAQAREALPAGVKQEVREALLTVVDFIGAREY
ncbi:MAG TPA: polyprenyl synthetase family protein [Patescibacteria group bacterium]|nr:polyprenyl synthetase family protein [Patescibacteria group bacterium]